MVIVGSDLSVNGYKIKLSRLRPFRLPGTDPGETLVDLPGQRTQVMFFALLYTEDKVITWDISSV